MKKIVLKESSKKWLITCVSILCEILSYSLWMIVPYYLVHQYGFDFDQVTYVSVVLVIAWVFAMRFMESFFKKEKKDE